MSDSDSYIKKKQQFERMLTVFGRKPVLESLRDPKLHCYAVHLADSNKRAGIVEEILAAAEQHNTPVKYHTRQALSRISRNGKQDQGVAADILCPNFINWEDFLAAADQHSTPLRLLALDGISNPQNLGMMIRSAAAGNIDGILYTASQGNASLGPLVIKASVGTVFQAPLIICKTLPESLSEAKSEGFTLCSLEANAAQSLFDYRTESHSIYVLGNETEGVSKTISQLADVGLSIPMRNGVESLNVAVTASLIAYANVIGKPSSIE